MLLYYGGYFERKMSEELTTKDLFCKSLRCQRYLGKIIDDGVLFEVGNIQLFDSFRASCLCGKSFTFRCRSFSTVGFKDEGDDATRKILNGLGKRVVGRPPRIADNFDELED